ncbi:hypothetical protein CUMW_235950 [Citrus unshiu]|uniref:Uncharacterized protein n=1 Tax=Citrus unshiu TaxID=55188 RepID=A0A2H5QJH2_CITUN|nr:hypothetical protein CUMW_235950 [Citrus unshiu]
MNPKRSPIMPLSFFPALSLSTIEPSDLLDFDEQLSGQDKNAQNSSMTTTPLSSRKSRSDTHAKPPPPGVTLEINGYETRLNVTNYDYSRRVFGATLDSISRSRSGRYNSSNRHY